MSYQEAYREPYTKYPNRYNDIIKPRLTGTQRDICDVVIRMTYGWHETSAAISNAAFARKANKSIQGIIKARKQLEDIGLLVILEKGGGFKISRYMLDLHYDDPEKSVRASIIRQEEQLLEMERSSPSEEQEDAPDLLDTPATGKPTIFEELQPEVEAPPVESEELPAEDLIAGSEDHAPEEAPVIDEPIGFEEPEVGNLIVAQETLPEENHAPVEKISDSGSHTSQAEISATAAASNTDGDDICAEEGTKLSLPPYIEDSSNNISGEERKQTVNTGLEETKPEKKKAAATVRYQFLSLFPDARADDDWKFFGWVAKTYGLDTCLAKLDYMKEHHKQHSITNPKGFFRTALVKDFQPPAFVLAKLKADEAARRGKERCRKESEEWRSMTAGFSYETASASLQKLLDTLN